MPLIMRSIRSGSTGRLRMAISTDRADFFPIKRYRSPAFQNGQFAQLNTFKRGKSGASRPGRHAGPDRRVIVGRLSFPGCRHRPQTDNA